MRLAQGKGLMAQAGHPDRRRAPSIGTSRQKDRRNTAVRRALPGTQHRHVVVQGVRPALVQEAEHSDLRGVRRRQLLQVLAREDKRAAVGHLDATGDLAFRELLPVELADASVPQPPPAAIMDHVERDPTLGRCGIHADWNADQREGGHLLGCGSRHAYYLQQARIP
ncbi:hypothetical protein GCM10023335_55180 [Streptomyces siamensis]|uniref:Uncharacterized protein n=1 Tax=Streptomyces siamensis TaxID=1274986 RepID=A0ABP9J9D8_9ACTN